MARMILKEHNSTCPWGAKCCATVVSGRGRHKTQGKSALKRALKKRDRQAALKGES